MENILPQPGLQGEKESQKVSYPKSHFQILREIQRMATETGAFDGVRLAVVALSGGIDSSVLLHQMMHLKKKGGPGIVAVHVHHGVRENEADRDARSAEEFAASCGAEFHLYKVRPSKGKLAAEHELRSLRLEALRKAAKEVGAERILLAHHLDDQAETVLLRFLTGADVRGLSAMRSYRNSLWVRPLLSVRRTEIIREAHDCNIPFVEDSTNRLTHSRRNFIRKNLLPLLRTQINPQIDRHLSDLADSMARLHEFLKEEASGHLKTASKGRGVFDVSRLGALQPAVRHTALQMMYQEVAGADSALRRPQLHALDRLVSGSGEPKSYRLPRGVQAVRNGKRIIFRSG